MSNPISDGAGGVIIGWSTITGGQRDIRSQRVDAAGTKRWGPDGVAVIAVPGDHHVQFLREDGSGGTFVFWEDWTSDSDIYGQRLDSNGNLLWAANGASFAVAGSAQNLAGGLVSDGQGGVLLAFQDNRNGNLDIYAHRINSGGQAVWQSGGAPLVTTSAQQEVPRLIKLDGNGGLIVVWGETGTPVNQPIKAQRFDSTGLRRWGTEGILVSTGTFSDLLMLGPDRFLFTWDLSGDIFMQLVRDVPGPLPPSELRATPLEGRKIQLDWVPSPSLNVAHYNVYYDSGTGIINYSVRITSVPASSTTFITSPFTASVTYRLGIRTVDTNGVEELNTHVVASATAIETSTVPVKAAIKVPQSGKRVTGNRVTIMAELMQGNASDAKDIRFQYRDAITTTTAWQDIIPATIQHPNPDTDSPYFVHWDIDSFPEGTYELRAVATSRSDIADPSPATIFITIDHADPEVQEQVSGSGVQKRQKVNDTVTNTIQVGDPQSGVLTKVTVPVGAISASSTTLRLNTSPSSVPTAPEGASSANIFREITLESGQTALSNGQSATITATYPDEDNNGIVDGLGITVDRLALYRYNAAANRWDRLTSTVDKVAKTVSAPTPGFSIFGFFSPAATDLTDVLVYPVPWVPNDGNADNGKPFSAADPTSGIVFDNLTQSARIQIFTVSGELVWKREVADSSGRIQWDGRNNSGRDVASGGYFAVITDTAAGSKVRRKIAIIR